jgi:hypothetical protein
MPARTELDINITIAAGEARKLVVLWGSNADPGTISATFDQAGIAFPMIAISGTAGQSESGSLHCAGFYLDTPPEGAKVVRITTSNAVRSAVSLKVYKDARAGMPEVAVVSVTGSQIFDLMEEGILIDAFSETCDIVLGTGLSDGGLTPLAGQTAGADDVINGAFLATASGRTHDHSGPVEHGWTAAAAADLLLLAVNIPFSLGQAPAPSTFTPLSQWLFDGSDPTEFANEEPRGSAFRQTGTVQPNIDPLLDDGGHSISISGARIVASNHVDYQVQSWSAEIYFQLRTLPASTENRPLFGKDTNQPSGGVQIEVYNDGGTGKLRAYIRNSVGGIGTAVWVDESGISPFAYGTIAVNTAYAVWLTFEAAAAPATGGTAKLWYRPAGGSVTLLVSKTDATFSGLGPNASPISICSRDGSTNYELDGIVDNVRFGAGVLSQAEIEARPPPLTVTDAPPTGIVMQNTIPLGPTAAGVTRIIHPEDHALSGLGAGVRDLTEITDSANRMSFLDDNTTTGRIQIGPLPDPGPSSPVDEQAIATITEDGRTSNQFTITWTREAATGGGGYTPFAFKTNLSPSSYNHTGVTAKPGFNASDPKSAAITDPMSGLRLWRLSPNRGTEIRRNGTIATGLFQPRYLRNQNAPTQEVWNRDTKLLMIDHAPSYDGDPSNSCRSMLIDVDGQQGAGGPWRVLRASGASSLGDSPGSSVRFWDWQDPPHGDPNRMFVLLSNGSMKQWFPKTGVVSAISGWPAYPSGFTLPEMDTYWVFTSADGRYYAQPARRGSDERWGFIRRDLRTGDLGPFVESENFPNDSAAAGPSGISQNGQVTANAYQGHEFWFKNLTNGSYLGKTPDVEVSHAAWAEVNDKQYLIGAHSNTGFRMWDIAAKARVQLITDANLKAVNSHHTGTQNYLDRFETYGGTGSGATSGHRYAIFGRANEGNMQLICGIRLGPNDVGKTPPVGRVICCHRSRKRFHTDNPNEAHNQPSRDMRYVVFASNWAMEGCSGTDDQSQAYVVEIPDGWKSPNNDGS